MDICYVPGRPLVLCYNKSVIGGVAVDFLEGKLQPYAHSNRCIQSIYQGISEGCSVISGRVDTLRISRIRETAFANYSLAQPFAASEVSIIFATTRETPAFIFFKPFTLVVWVVLMSSICVAIVSILCINRGMFVNKTIVRDALTSFLGYTRLYKGSGTSYYQHGVSMATAVFSVVVVSLYSSNLIARAYITQLQTPDFTSKPILYDRTGFKWYLDLHRDYVKVRADVLGDYGTLNATVIDLVARGENYLILENILMEGICSPTHDTLFSSVVSKLRTTYLPLVRNDVAPDVFDRLVYTSNGLVFYPNSAACLYPDTSSLKGLDLRESWVVFATLAGVMLLLVGIKVSMFVINHRTHDLPEEADVVMSRRPRFMLPT